MQESGEGSEEAERELKQENVRLLDQVVSLSFFQVASFCFFFNYPPSQENARLRDEV